MRKNLALAVSVLALAVAAVGTPAWAQDDEAAAGRGIKSGSLVFKPSLLITAESNDNIYTEDTNEESDVVTKITPKVVVDTVTAPSKLQFVASATERLYADNSDDNRFDYTLGVNAGADLSDAVKWDGSVDHRRLHNDRGDDQTNPLSDATKPTVYNVTRAKTSLTVESGAVTFKPRLGLQSFNYKDYTRLNNTVVDQDFRDRDEYTVGGRLGYDLKNDFTVFVDGEFNPRNYDVSSATERSSDGGSYLAGFTYKPSKDMKAELAAGYMNREYDKGTVYEDVDTFDASAMWEWAFEEGSKVKATYERSVVEVTDTGVGGAKRNDFRVIVDKKLTDKLSGDAEARYINTDYQGGNGATSGTEDREDDQYLLGVGLDYALTEQVSLTADYNYTNRDSNLNTADYDRNVFMLGVKFEY